MSEFSERSNRYESVLATADGVNVIQDAPGVGLAILVLNYFLRVVGAGDATINGITEGDIPLAGAAAPGISYQASGNSDAVGVIKLAVNTPLTITNAVGVDAIGHITYRIVQA